MKCCKDLQIAFTSNDSFSSVIHAVERCEDTFALHKRLKRKEVLQAIL